MCQLCCAFMVYSLYCCIISERDCHCWQLNSTIRVTMTDLRTLGFCDDISSVCRSVYFHTHPHYIISDRRQRERPDLTDSVRWSETYWHGDISFPVLIRCRGVCDITCTGWVGCEVREWRGGGASTALWVLSNSSVRVTFTDLHTSSVLSGTHASVFQKTSALFLYFLNFVKNATIHAHCWCDVIANVTYCLSQCCNMTCC